MNDTHMKTKLFTLFFALVASVGTMFASVTINGLDYSLDEKNKTAEVTYKSYQTNFGFNYDWSILTADIPETFTYNGKTYKVTSIGDYAFANCKYLTSVSIPSSVTSIGNQAFNGCVKLSTVNIPNSVMSIGKYVFTNCSNLPIVDDIRYADTYLVEATDRSLSSYTIKDGTRYIGYGAFAQCSYMTSIAIPNCVIEIGQMAFNKCTSLADVTIGSGVMGIGQMAFDGCTSLADVTIGSGVIGIESNAFNNCPIQSIHISDVAAWCGILHDDYTPFGRGGWDLYVNDKLVTDLVIPDGVGTIQIGVFSGCRSLTSVTIPNTLDTISPFAFNYCVNLTSFNVAEDNPSLYTIDGVLCKDNYLCLYPFAKNGAYRIPDSITGIGYGAFWLNDGLTSITFHDHIQYIDPFLIYVPIYVPCGMLDSYKARISEYSVSIHNDISSFVQYAPLPFALTCTVSPEDAGQISEVQNVCEWPLVATSNYGYHFVKWSDGVADSARTIELTQDTVLTAIFAKNTYTINTVSSNPQWGMAQGGKKAQYLDEVEISATPNEHYHFEYWNDRNTDNPRKIKVTQDSTFTAIFAPNIYRIYLNGSVGGYISGPEEAEYLQNVSLYAESEFGYHFTQWSDGNTENPREFVITQDTTFTAEFAKNTSGQCGNKLSWAFNDGQLSITGSGDMYAYDQNNVPWLLLKPEIKTVSCSPEMTSISAYAFSGINTSKFNTIILPTNLVSIGSHAFDGDSFLEKVDFGANLEHIGNFAFRGCTRIMTMTSWAEFTPNIEYASLSDISDYAELYVLPSAFRKFQVDNNWNRFVLKEIGANKTTNDVTDVSVVPDNNSANIVWPAVSGAATYELVIKDKAGNVICTLVFNENGQLTSIAFNAPGRNAAQKTQSAGFSFTVTGLEEGTAYDLSIVAKDSNGSTLQTKTISFQTESLTAIQNIQTDKAQSTKILRNGQILILRGDRPYTLTGAEVK